MTTGQTRRVRRGYEVDPFLRRARIVDAGLISPRPATERASDPSLLRELVTAYGMIGVDPDKEKRVRDSLDDYFRVKWTETLESRLTLTAAEAATLIGMTPSARHGAARPVEGLTTTTAAVQISAYIRN